MRYISLIAAAGSGDAAEGEGADDGIEPVICEGEVLGVSFDEGDVNAELGGPVAGYIEHGRAEVDPRQLDSSRVEGQVPAGTDCDLQYLAGRPRACPFAAITEQQKIVEARVAVVAWRVLFPEAAQPVGHLSAGHGWSPRAWFVVWA
jgi:hypothetical protein